MKRFLFKTLLLLLATSGHCLLLAEDLPEGFKIETGKQFHVTGELVRIINIEEQSLDREHYIDRYISFLNSSDENVRIFGAWALGQFQSRRVLETLLMSFEKETSTRVKSEIYCDLAINFGVYGPENFEIKNKEDFSIPTEHIEEWKASLKKLGYDGLVFNGWRNAKSGGLEAMGFYVTGITARYDPELVPTFLKLIPQMEMPEFKEVMENTVLSWSGYDLKKQTIQDVEKDLLSPDALSPSNVCTRYMAYFNDAGYRFPSSSFKETGLAVLFGESREKFQYRREMALRMLSWTPKGN